MYKLTQAQSFRVNKTSGCLARAEKIGLQRTHFDMNKFGKENDEEYRTVRWEIQGMASRGPGLLADRRQHG